MNREKPFCVIGVILGIAMIIAGIVVMANSPGSPSTSYTKIASFGADFYSYEYEATKNAADNAEETAYAVYRLHKSLTVCAGLGFIFAGSLALLKNLKRLVVCSAPVIVKLADGSLPASDSVPQPDKAQADEELPDL